MKIKYIFKKIIIRLPYGKRILQIIKTITLLRVKSFRKLFFEVKRGDICIDLGANIGYASMIMWLKGAKKIYALEPNPEAFKKIKSNLYGIKNITVLNLAISNTNRKEKLFLHKSIKNISDVEKILELSEASSLLSDKANIGKSFYDIDAIDLNTLICEFVEKPDLIKCDIEGAEYIIYDQLIKFAKEYDIRKIFVECHAKKYPKYNSLHKKFINLISKNNLQDKFDVSWH